jgi:hypothetical protein
MGIIGRDGGVVERRVRGAEGKKAMFRTTCKIDPLVNGIDVWMG